MRHFFTFSTFKRGKALKTYKKTLFIKKTRNKIELIDVFVV